MKAILSSVVFFLLIAGTTLFNACTKDPCDKIVCKNNGICRDGRCNCGTIGYEGPLCEVKMNEKYIGVWDGTYRCNGGINKTVSFVIAPGATAKDVVIYNFYTQNITINATVNVDKINIPFQSVNGYSFRGNGYIEGIYMTLYIEQTEPSDPIMKSCVYNGTKYIKP
jgi:hypothetical protein